MTSLYSLMGLSIERWLIITRPGKFSLNSYTATSIIIAAAWGLSLMVSLPPLVGWAYFAPETSGMRFVLLHMICGQYYNRITIVATIVIQISWIILMARIFLFLNLMI